MLPTCEFGVDSVDVVVPLLHRSQMNRSWDTSGALPLCGCEGMFGGTLPSPPLTRIKPKQGGGAVFTQDPAV